MADRVHESRGLRQACPGVRQADEVGGSHDPTDRLWVITSAHYRASKGLQDKVPESFGGQEQLALGCSSVAPGGQLAVLKRPGLLVTYAMLQTRTGEKRGEVIICDPRRNWGERK